MYDNVFSSTSYSLLLFGHSHHFAYTTIFHFLVEVLFSYSTLVGLVPHQYISHCLREGVLFCILLAWSMDRISKVVESWLIFDLGLICDCKYDPYRPGKCFKNDTCTAPEGERIVCYATLSYEEEEKQIIDNYG